MNSLSGYLGHHGQGDVPWDFVVSFTAIAVLGIVAGASFVKHIRPQQLKRAFALLLVVIGVLILWQNRAQL